MIFFFLPANKTNFMGREWPSPRCGAVIAQSHMHYLRGCAILFHKLKWKLIVVFFCFRKSGQNKIYSIPNERCSDPRDKHTNLNRSPTKKKQKKKHFNQSHANLSCQLGPKQVSMGMKWQPLIGWMKRRLASEPKT